MCRQKTIADCLLVCQRFYDEETLLHAERVYRYVQKNLDLYPHLSPTNREAACYAALLHDIIEDTNCTVECLQRAGFNKEVIEAVKILTKPKGEKYASYCGRIKHLASEFWLDKNFETAARIAYIVKLADMKDHLSQKDTLTDRLKEKYLTGLAELL